MDLNKLPKVELHLHLDCSLSYDVVSRIDPSITHQYYLNHFVSTTKCTDLADFIERAGKGFLLMQTQQQLEWVVQDMFKQLAADNMLYVELRFAPLQHLLQGLTPYEVVKITEAATAEAVKQTGIEARLILCTLRHYTEAQSMETVKLVEQFKNTYVSGFDIAANEAGFPIYNHIAAFKYAKEKNIFCTAHAGEAKGAESVWETLEHFGPTRIGHGVRSIEDGNLITHLCKHNIHLEICPTSNVLIDVVDTYENHPIDQLYKAGVSISVNTDNRTITNITLGNEYEKMQQFFNWMPIDFYNCNVNALKAAFIPEALKAQLLAKLLVGYESLTAQMGIF